MLTADPLAKPSYIEGKAAIKTAMAELERRMRYLDIFNEHISLESTRAALSVVEGQALHIFQLAKELREAI